MGTEKGPTKDAKKDIEAESTNTENVAKVNKDQSDKNQKNPKNDLKGKTKNKHFGDIDDSELSEEDKKKKEFLNNCVQAVCSVSDESEDSPERTAALESLADDLRRATDSVASVPKTLKFLRPHFDALAKRFKSLPDCHNKKFLADILSVLATTITPTITKTPTSHSQPPSKGPSVPPPDPATVPSADQNEKVASPEDTKEEDSKSMQYPKLLSLRYRVSGGVTDLVSWGQEYIRNLTGQIIAEYNAIKGRRYREASEEKTVSEDKDTAVPTVEELTALSDLIIPFNMKRNAETDAIDLAAEVDCLHKIPQYVDKNNMRRVVIYLCGISLYASSTDEFCNILGVAFEVLFVQDEWVDALRVAIKLGDSSKIDHVVKSCTDPLVLKQLAMIAFRQRLIFSWYDVAGIGSDDSFGEELTNLAGGDWMSAHFLTLAKELDVLEPKLPEDVYKTHLEERRPEALSIDSAKQNLAATFANAFVNVGFCKDKLMSVEDSTWLYKNKDHGMTSAAAALGAINLWNVNQGLGEVDKLQWSENLDVKSGAFLAFGLFNASVKNEFDPAAALLSDHLEDNSLKEKIGAVLGLGFAYVACQRTDLSESLIPIAIDMSNSIELSAMSALSLGLIFVSSCNEDVAEAIVQTLIERSMSIGPIPDDDMLGSKTGGAGANSSSAAEGEKEDSTEKCFSFLISVGLGLIFLGRRDLCETTLSALEVVASPIREYAMMTVEGMAFAGTGEVLRVQRMLQICADPRAKSSKDSKEAAKESPTSTAHNALEKSSASTTAAKDEANTGGADAQGGSTRNACSSFTMDQAVAVLNIPLIAMGEDTGSEMVLRILDHLLQYAEMPMRRAVPLALALQSSSNPKPQVVDTLSKLSHDQDANVALRAIFALGIVGAGTNNSRIAGLLRQLASYYSKDPNALFTVRVAQGLVHMGKGLVSLSPMHSDGFLLDPAVCGCMIALMHICLNMRKLILGRHHYLLYLLIPAVFPRMFMTVDEELKPINVTVRVGQNVDVVGQAGYPKTITGFQTHTTPVLLGAGERAELADDDYIPLSSVLEGVVILRKRDDKDKEKLAELV